jgi:hypothetical protein
MYDKDKILLAIPAAAATATRHTQALGWIAPYIGTLLIVIACFQLMHSATLYAAAIGVRLLEAFVNALRTLASLGPDKSGEPIIRSVMVIWHLGIALAVSCLIGGIMMLRERASAIYFIASALAFAVVLGAYHLLIAWYSFAAIYSGVAAVLVVSLIFVWLLHGSPEVENGRPHDEAFHRSTIKLWDNLPDAAE